MYFAVFPWLLEGQVYTSSLGERSNGQTSRNRCLVEPSKLNVGDQHLTASRIPGLESSGGMCPGLAAGSSGFAPLGDAQLGIPPLSTYQAVVFLWEIVVLTSRRIICFFIVESRSTTRGLLFLSLDWVVGDGSFPGRWCCWGLERSFDAEIGSP
jgi:hypothetical protein